MNKRIVKKVRAIQEKLVGKIIYSTSILHLDQEGIEEKVKQKIKKELLQNIQNNMNKERKVLDKIIKEMNKLSDDSFFKTSFTILTAKPFKKIKKGETPEKYNSETFKRFDAFNTVCLYMFSKLSMNPNNLSTRLIQVTKKGN